MNYESAAQLRDQLKAIQKSWIWVNFILPYFEKSCADLMERAHEPVPDKPEHTEARYRLAELRAFQAYLLNLEANAAEFAVGGDPSLLDRGPGEEEEYAKRIDGAQRSQTGREGDEEKAGTF